MRSTVPRHGRACPGRAYSPHCRALPAGDLNTGHSTRGSPALPSNVSCEKFNGERLRNPSAPNRYGLPRRRDGSTLVRRGNQHRLRSALAQPATPAPASLTPLPCPACARVGGHVLRFRSNGCDILQCPSCGLGRAQASVFDPAAYYTEDYFSGGHADGYSDYLGAEPVLRREFARSIDFIRRFRPGGKLLELGCAYGFFLQEAARYYEVAGIELAADAAAHCRRAGLNVLERRGRRSQSPPDRSCRCHRSARCYRAPARAA